MSTHDGKVGHSGTYISQTLNPKTYQGLGCPPFRHGGLPQAADGVPVHFSLRERIRPAADLVSKLRQYLVTGTDQVRTAGRCVTQSILRAQRNGTQFIRLRLKTCEPDLDSVTSTSSSTYAAPRVWVVARCDSREMLFAKIMSRAHAPPPPPHQISCASRVSPMMATWKAHNLR